MFRISYVVSRCASGLGSFGFVFFGEAEWDIGVNPPGIRGCGARFDLEIGFVLHNNVINVWQAGLYGWFGARGEGGRQETECRRQKTEKRRRILGVPGRRAGVGLGRAEVDVLGVWAVPVR